MIRPILLVGALLAGCLGLAGNGAARPNKAQAKMPELRVRPGYELRKDFSAFEDVYPAERRNAELKEYNPDDGGTIWFDVYDLGTITVRSGKIAAFDPIVFTGGTFAKEVAKGTYPVLLAVAVCRMPEVRGKTSESHTVVFARVQLAARPAVRWELALFEDDQLNEKSPAKLTGYGVDSGMGAFADGPCQAVFQKARDEKMSQRIDEVIDRLYGARSGAPRFAKVTYGKAEMIQFGWFGGDGSYPSYWGYDKDGKAVALMTDFKWREWKGRPNRGK